MVSGNYSTNPNYKLLQFTGNCPSGKIAIAGGYTLLGKDISHSAAVIKDNIFAGDSYSISVEEPLAFSGTGTNVIETDAYIKGARLQFSCARVEPTLHQFRLDY